MLTFFYLFLACIYMQMRLCAIFCCKYKKNIDSCQELAPNFLQYLTLLVLFFMKKAPFARFHRKKGAQYGLSLFF